MCIPAKKRFITLNHKSVEIVPAPIDEKNIVSDWIDGELLDYCTQNGNEYLGWLNDKYPVYGKVDKNGALVLHPFDTVVIPLLRDKLMEIFHEDSNNHIYVHIECFSTSLKVSFYFILDD